MRITDRRLHARITGQHGLVTRRQLLGAGVTDSAIAWQCARGHWAQVHPGVYLTTPGREDWHMRAVAALLAIGAPSALTHASAAYAWGLTKHPPDFVEVVVPAGRRGTGRDGVQVIRSARFSDRADELSWPPCTTAADTVLDLGERLTLDGVLALAGVACQKKVTTPEALGLVLAGRRSHRHGRILREVLTDVGAAQSAAEIRYLLDVERAHGLPKGERQAPGPDGIRRDVDYAGLGMVVEVDGRVGHIAWGDRRRDGRRDRKALGLGKVTVRAFWPDVTVDTCELASDLSQILRQRGWLGSPRPCRRAGCDVRGERRAS